MPSNMPRKAPRFLVLLVISALLTLVLIGRNETHLRRLYYDARTAAEASPSALPSAQPSPPSPSPSSAPHLNTSAFVVHDSRPGGAGCSLPALDAHSATAQLYYERLPTVPACPATGDRALTAADPLTGWLWVRPDRAELAARFRCPRPHALRCAVEQLVRIDDDRHRIRTTGVAEPALLRWGRAGRVRVRAGVRFVRVRCRWQVSRLDTNAYPESWTTLIKLNWHSNNERKDYIFATECVLIYAE